MVILVYDFSGCLVLRLLLEGPIEIRYVAVKYLYTPEVIWVILYPNV